MLDRLPPVLLSAVLAPLADDPASLASVRATSKGLKGAFFRQ